MSWRPEVIADSSGQWVPNGQRFATREEALASAHDLMMRWILVQEFRATESEEPVNYAWREGRAVPCIPPA